MIHDVSEIKYKTTQKSTIIIDTETRKKNLLRVLINKYNNKQYIDPERKYDKG